MEHILCDARHLNITHKNPTCDRNLLITVVGPWEGARTTGEGRERGPLGAARGIHGKHAVGRVTRLEAEQVLVQAAQIADDLLDLPWLLAGRRRGRLGHSLEGGTDSRASQHCAPLEP